VLDGRPDQQTFGGIDMVVRRNAFGRQVDSFETDLDLEGLEGDPVHAVFIRAPWVEQVGRGVEVLARVSGPEWPGAGDGGPKRPGAAISAADGRIVAVRQGNLLATSFHPELTGDLRVHALFAGMVVEATHAAA
jgi:5'-phosphate synthase pdxT subunit